MIICKGFKKNGILNSCNFVYEGDWGDKELLNHEKQHKLLEDGESYFWLGFEVKRSFNKITNRDGKP